MINLLRKKYDMMLATLQEGSKPYYCELEYLESTGTQYIDTGRVPNNTDIIEQKFCKKGSDSGTIAWYGSMPSASSALPRIAIGQFEPSGLTKKFFAGVNTTAQIANADNNVHTFRFYASSSTEITYILDGVKNTERIISPGNAYSPVVQLTSYLFARHGVNGVQVYDGSGTKIYYHKEFLANGTLVLDLIPVLDWNYVPCMYDRVTKQLFYNQGINDFLYGREIHEVEYIENVKDTTTTTNPATQYIDTGIVPAGTKISGRIKYCYVDKIVTEAMVGGTTADNTANLRIGTLTGKYRIKWNNVNSSDNGVNYTGETLEPLTILEDEFNSDTGFSSNGVQLVDKHLTSVSSCTNTIKLFTDTTTGSVLGYNSSGKRLYYCQIYQDDVLVRDFIPAVDENGVGFLFDKANRKIYDNAGTGSFSYPDVELEYIESTGTQYFDTGYTQTQNTELSVDCAFTDLSSGRFGSVKLVGGNTYRFYFGVLDNKWIGAVNNISPDHNIATADYNRHQFDLNATGLYIDGELKVAPSNSYPLTTITLFNLNTISISTIASAKLYSCTIGESGVLVKNYIPVIHNGVACLKDTVNNTYLINAGTGAFLTGKIKESA